MLGVALNEVFVPILQKQFPEIVDFYLPPGGPYREDKPPPEAPEALSLIHI